MKTISLITTQRQHLFDLTAQLMEALDPASLLNPENPIEITVNGSFQAGKTIFTDAAVEHCLGQDILENNKASFARKIWTGMYGGHPMQIKFCNYTSHLVALSSDLKREHGGIDFLQNALRGDVQIYLEKYGQAYQSQQTAASEKPSLVSAFEHLSQENDWTRFVRINICNDRLAMHPNMEKFIKAFQTNEVPIYGASIPR